MRTPSLPLMVLVAALAAAPAIGQTPAPAPAETTATAPALDMAGFLHEGTSLAAFAVEAGGHVLRSANRPEVMDLARAAVQLHAEILQRLRSLAEARSITVPEGMMLEHRAVLDGLTPLDGEELHRRYVQSQAQALAREVQLYQQATDRNAEPALGTLGSEIMPRLQEQAAMAQRTLEAVQP